MFVLFFLLFTVRKNLNKSKNPTVINVGSIYGEKTPDWSIYKNTNINNPAGYSLVTFYILQSGWPKQYLQKLV